MKKLINFRVDDTMLAELDRVGELLYPKPPSSIKKNETISYDRSALLIDAISIGLKQLGAGDIEPPRIRNASKRNRAKVDERLEQLSGRIEAIETIDAIARKNQKDKLGKLEQLMSNNFDALQSALEERVTARLEAIIVERLRVQNLSTMQAELEEKVTARLETIILERLMDQNLDALQSALEERVAARLEAIIVERLADVRDELSQMVSPQPLLLS